MPDSRSPFLTSIEFPRCPKCRHARMILARIAPGPQGDVRTFECTKCDHAHIVTVASDPRKTNNLALLNGELKPPN